MDAIPFFSQAKSLVQFMAGQPDAALRTQENFSKQCLGISQLRSVVERSLGDEEAARNTEREFLDHVDESLNTVPVVGYVKGVVHYALGDVEAGNTTMLACTTSSAVGLSGLLTASVIDGAITGVDSAIHNEYRPHGVFKDETNLGKGCVEKTDMNSNAIQNKTPNDQDESDSDD